MAAGDDDFFRGTFGDEGHANAPRHTNHGFGGAGEPIVGLVLHQCHVLDTTHTTHTTDSVLYGAS